MSELPVTAGDETHTPSFSTTASRRMRELDLSYEALAVRDRARQEGSLSHAMRIFLKKDVPPRTVYDEINHEIIALDMVNVRHTHRFFNRLFRWRRALHQATPAGPVEVTVSDYRLHTIWLEGVVEYFQRGIAEGLAAGGDGLPLPPELPEEVEEEHLPELLRRARQTLAAGLGDSPGFAAAVGHLARLGRALRLAEALVEHLLAKSSAPSGPRAGDVVGDLLRRRLRPAAWVYRLLLLLWGVLQGEQAALRGVLQAGPGEAAGPASVDVVAALRLLLPRALPETSAATDCLALHHLLAVHAAAAAVFPAGPLRSVEEANGDDEDEDAGEALFRWFTEQLPAWVAAEEALSDRVGVERAWTRHLLYRALFPPPAAFSEGADKAGEDTAADRLTRLLLALLRPRLRPLLCPAARRHAAEAVRLRLAVAAVAEGLRLVPSTRRRRWSLLPGGPPPTTEDAFGRAALGRAVDRLVAEALEAGLRGRLGPGTRPMLTEAEAEAFLARELLPTEPFWAAPRADVAPAALHRCSAGYYRGVDTALRRVCPALGAEALRRPLLHRLHRFLLDVAGETETKETKETKGEGPRAALSALRLVAALPDREPFLERYLALLRLRVLHRPAPGGPARRERRRLARRDRWEQWALHHLAAAHGAPSEHLLAAEDVRRAARTHLLPPGPGRTALVVTTLDWRRWDLAGPEAPLAASSSSASTEGGLHLLAAPSLPFPPDVWAALGHFHADLRRAHPGRTLLWHRHALATFTLVYPRDAGRRTTVHGSLLLQRLFLLLAAHGRRGVALARLAEAAELDPRQVESLLRRGGEADGLWVRLGGGPDGPAEAVRFALHYDFVRPATSRDGVYVYWPAPPRATTPTQGKALEQAQRQRDTETEAVVMSLLKHSQSLAYDELLAAARARLSGRVELTEKVLKRVLDSLVTKEYLQRSGVDRRVFHYLP